MKLISLRGDDQIASVCRVPKGDDEEVVAEGEEPTTDSESPAESGE